MSVLFNKCLTNYNIIIIFLLCCFTYFFTALHNGLIFGALYGVILLILVVNYVIKRNSFYLILFYFLTFTFGNVKFSISGLNYHDLTYWISIIIFYYIVAKDKLYLIFLLYSHLFLQTFYSNTNLDDVFGLLGQFSQSFTFGYFLFFKKIKSKLLKKILIYIALFLIVFNMLQFIGFDFVLRKSFVAYSIFGFDLYRPSGLYGSVHNAGSKVILSCLIIVIYNTNYILPKHPFIFLCIILSSFSQRSFMLAFIILKLLRKPIIILLICISTPFFIFQHIDPSNALKLFMWFYVFQNIEFNSFDFLIGHGIGSCSKLLSFVDFSNLANQYNVSRWDIIPTHEKLPHNIFVHILYDLGSIYFILYCTIFLYIARKLYKYNILIFTFFFLYFINFNLHNGLFSYLNIFLPLVYLKNQSKYQFINCSS